MKKLRLTLCLAVGLAFSPAASFAADYPDHQIRWVMPGQPGEGGDVSAREIAHVVGEELGQTIYVDNKPGAGGVLASQLVASAAPDGYTMIIGTAGSHEINAAVRKNLKYDVVESFSPIALFCTAPNVLVVSPSIDVKDVPELVALAKEKPGELNYASGGVGSSAHLSGALFASKADVDMRHVPFKGATPAVADVMAGRVQLMIGNLPHWMSLIEAGKVKALAVTGAERVPELPDVPTMAEYFPGFQTEAWYGLFAPAGTPQEIITLMNASVNKALENEKVIHSLKTMACPPAPGTPEEYSERIKKNVAVWKQLAADNNISID